MKPEKLRELTEDAIAEKLNEMSEQLFRLRFQKSLGQLDNPLKLREVRRDIARARTIQRERQAAKHE